MSKYEPLWKAVRMHTEDSFTLTYAEIEAILGFPIDHSFLSFKKELPAYGYADTVAAESRKSDRFYPYLDDFAALLHHKNSLVRNRAISILNRQRPLGCRKPL